MSSLSILSDNNEGEKVDDEAAIQAQMASEVYELSLSSHVDVFKKS